MAEGLAIPSLVMTMMDGTSKGESRQEVPVITMKGRKERKAAPLCGHTRLNISLQERNACGESDSDRRRSQGAKITFDL